MSKLFDQLSFINTPLAPYYYPLRLLFFLFRL